PLYACDALCGVGGFGSLREPVSLRDTQQCAQPWLECFTYVGIGQGILVNGLQIVDRVADCKPFAIDNRFGHHSSATPDVFANSIRQPQLVSLALRNLSQNLNDCV